MGWLSTVIAADDVVRSPLQNSPGGLDAQLLVTAFPSGWVFGLGLKASHESASSVGNFLAVHVGRASRRNTEVQVLLVEGEESG